MKRQIQTHVDISHSVDVGHDIDRYSSYRETNEARQIELAKLVNFAIAFARRPSIECAEHYMQYWHFEIPPEPPTNYAQEAEDDAKGLITDYFMDEIIEMLINDGEASDDMYNDYDNGDSIFHENITDKWYHSTDASELIDQLREHEEEDSGLWEGVNELDRIASIKAAYTYGNAVNSEWNSLIEEINEIDIDDMKWEIATEILKNNDSDNELLSKDGVEDEEIIEYVQNEYEDDFNDALKEELEKQIGEICN